jgi:hypothetical protein
LVLHIHTSASTSAITTRAYLSVFPHHVLVHLHHNLHRDQELAQAHALYYASPWVCLYLELVHPAHQQSPDDVSLLLHFSLLGG